MHAITMHYPRVESRAWAQGLFGSLFIALCALIWVPMYPIPMSLQTFAVVVLALVQGPKVACFSCLFYLAEATLGLPVLRGMANPLWFVGPTGGYLFAFPIAAFLIGAIAREDSSFVRKCIAGLCGHWVIYLFGWMQLSFFIGASAAFKGGVLWFIPLGLLKCLFAVSFLSIFPGLKSRLLRSYTQEN